MKDIVVSFKNPDEVIDFVRIVEKYPYTMDLCRGSIMVDAKSLMGIMNLGLNQQVNLRIYADHCRDLCNGIERFVAA